MTGRTKPRRRSRSRGLIRVLGAGLLIGCWAGRAAPAEAQTFYPVADGTLADGFSGSFDGTADAWDWYFNNSSFDGALVLAFDTLERRLVWEYDVSAVTLEPPIYATLTFTIRGAPVWPGVDAEVFIYSYPANLQEDVNDYSIGPATLEEAVLVSPYQEPTVYTLDVSGVVNTALSSGADMVAFRFQINPDAQEDDQQAYIDALDTDPTTKPYVTVTLAVPPILGDIDGDGDVDFDDLDAFVDVLLDLPGVPPAYRERSDLNGDGTADGDDIQVLVGIML